ncbi:hypothetical protein CLOM_g5486 [Closterium sp. NIES-68]|nr:hypothetical protein CLOM_g5486 [Closterium sp. NIES-68]
MDEDGGMSLFDGMDFVDPSMLHSQSDASPTVDGVDAVNTASSSQSPAPNSPSVSPPAESQSEELLSAGDQEKPNFSPQARIETSTSEDTGDARKSIPLDPSLFTSPSPAPPAATLAAASPAPAAIIAGSAAGSPSVLSPAAALAALSPSTAVLSPSLASITATAGSVGSPISGSPRASVTLVDSSASSGGSSAGLTAKPAGLVRKKKRSIRIGYARDSSEESAGLAAGSAEANGSTHAAGLAGSGSQSEMDAAAAGGQVLPAKEMKSGEGRDSSAADDADGESTVRNFRDEGLADSAGSVVPADDIKSGSDVITDGTKRDTPDSVSAGNGKAERAEVEMEGKAAAETADVAGSPEVEIQEGDHGTVDLSSSLATSAEPTGAATSDLEKAEREGMEGEAGDGVEAKKEAAEITASEEEPAAAAEEKNGGNDEESQAAGLGGELEREVKRLLADVAAKLAAVQAKIRDATSARKRAVQMRRQAAQRAAAAAKRLEEIEAELAAACEAEEFELADELSQRAERVAGEVKDWGGEVGQAEEQVARCSGEVLRLTAEEADLEVSAAQALRRIHRQAAAAAAEAKQTAAQQGEEEEGRVAAEEADMEIKKRKLAVERRVLDEERAELAAKVDAATSAERQERDELEKGRAELEAELAALMEQVRAKEQEIEQQNVLIAKVDGKISAVAGRFEKVRGGLEEEERKVGRMEEEVREMEKRVEEGRRRAGVVVEEGKRVAEGLEQVGSRAEEEARRLEEAVEGRRKEAEEEREVARRRDELAGAEKQAQAELEALGEEMGEVKKCLQDLSVARQKAQVELSSVQQRLAAAQRRIPELEAEKKAAAAARNFKEAARLAAEAKLYSNDRDTAERQLQECEEEIRRVEREEEGKGEELRAMEEMAREREREGGVARCARLRLVAVVARREMESAAEGEDWEEAEGLKGEAEAADSEADSLKEQYGLEGEEYERKE